MAALGQRGDPAAWIDVLSKNAKVLSDEGQTALKAILRSDHVTDIEKIIIVLATAFGLRD